MPAKGGEVAFPRTDNYFRTKESLAFQETYSRVWLIRPEGKWDSFLEFAAFPALGLGVGICGFVMDILEQLLVYLKDVSTQHMID